MTIQELESDVRLLKGMVAEQAEQIANLFALLEQLHPPGPIVPQSKPAAPPAGEAEVALRNGECEAKSHIISDLENENSKLRNRIGVLQASPPACEGERVDVEKLAEELTELMEPKAWWCGKFLPILRRHFPPAAPKPAVQDEQLSPANEKFLDEMLASKPAAGGESQDITDQNSLLGALAAANQRVDEAERLLRKCEHEFHELRNVGFNFRDILDEIHSFLTPKESGNVRLQPVPAAGSEPAQALPADDAEAIACLIERTDEWPDARLAVVHVRKRLAAQSAELDALRADKRRLDWLASGINFSTIDIVGQGTFNRLGSGLTQGLREAIDAAKEDKPNG